MPNEIQVLLKGMESTLKDKILYLLIFNQSKNNDNIVGFLAYEEGEYMKARTQMGGESK